MLFHEHVFFFLKGPSQHEMYYASRHYFNADFHCFIIYSIQF